MPEPFDPYATWLGIAPEDRPLTAYRLLGIEPAESDVRVITKAAETRLREVKRRADRAHAETAKRLAQEILAARNKLLRAAAKPADAAHAKPSKSTQPQSEATGKPTIAVSARQAALRTAPPRTWLQRFLANPFAGTVLGGVIAGVIYLGIVWWTGDGTDSAATPASDPEATEKRPAAVAKAVDPPPETAASSAQASDDGGTEEPGLLEFSEAPARLAAPLPPEDTSQTLPGPDEAAEAAADPIPDSKAAPSDGPGAAATEEAVEKNGPENPAAEANGLWSKPDELAAAQEQEAASEVEKDKRHAVPDEADQREAEKEVRKLLRDDFAAARTPEQSLGLARSLVKLAAETSSDLTTRYVLLHMAEERAADGGDLALACEAADNIAAEYDVEPWARKADALERVLVVARSVRGPSPIGLKAFEYADALVAEALEADRYPVARQMTATMLSAARRAKNAPLVHERAGRRTPRWCMN